MKKVKKIILGAIFAGLSIFTLTGCYGANTTLTLDGNLMVSPNIDYCFGIIKDATQNENSNLFINNKSFIQLDSYNADNIITGAVVTDFSSLFKLGLHGEQSVQIGQISDDMVDEGLMYKMRDGVYDLGLNIEIFDGFTLEDIWNKNLGGIQDRWDAQAVYEQYKNGTQSEREAIIKKWRPEYMFTINFNAPVVCEYGQEYVTTNGNQAIVNIGDMLADGGGYVRLNSSKINKNGVVAPIPNTVIDKYINKPVLGLNDVREKDWFANAVKYSIENNIMSGYGDGKFAPNDNVTFAQLAKIMANAGMESESSYTNLNIDHWANDALSWCIDNDLFIPSDLQENGSYSINKLDKPLTREEAIYSMSKFASLIKKQIASQKEPNIPDIMSVSNKYRDDIKLAYQYGITSGTDKNYTFSPTKTLKRAEVCQMFYNMKW